MVKKSEKTGEKVHIFGSGSIMNQVLKAQEILEKDFDISVDVWSATNYKQLRSDALNCARVNMLNPTKKKKLSYLELVLSKEEGVFVAVSDNMRLVPDQIDKWVPGGLFSLGTDGFGRSDTRENLRRFFEVDAECIVVAVLYQLSEKGKIKAETVEAAINRLGINVNKVFPHLV